MSVPSAPPEPASAHLWLELGRALRHPLHLGAEIVRRVRNDDTFTLAAALAYYFFFLDLPAPPLRPRARDAPPAQRD